MKIVLYGVIALVIGVVAFLLLKPSGGASSGNGGNQSGNGNGGNQSGSGSGNSGNTNEIPVPPPVAPPPPEEPKCTKCPTNFKYDGNACRHKLIAPQGAKLYFEGQSMRYKVSRGSKGTDKSDCISGSAYRKSTFKGNYCEFNDKVPSGSTAFTYEGRFYVTPNCED
jgi:hypothetical protein